MSYAKPISLLLNHLNLENAQYVRIRLSVINVLKNVLNAGSRYAKHVVTHVPSVIIQPYAKTVSRQDNA